jgi:two-component system phosphate regulon sensor histidine kinase PhoR
MVKATDELECLLDKLLTLSTVGADGDLTPSGQTRLEPLLNTVIGGPIHLPSNLAIRLRIPEGLPLVVGDDTLLSQVFHNLLDNAVKYSPDGGRITIAANVTASTVTVSVADEGLGIHPDELSKVFHPFYRGLSVRTHCISGSGLGLAVCQKIVAAYGGRIWIDSPSPQRSPGTHPGTIVTVALRVATPAAYEREPDNKSFNGRDLSEYLATLWTTAR